MWVHHRTYTSYRAFKYDDIFSNKLFNDNTSWKDVSFVDFSNPNTNISVVSLVYCNILLNNLFRNNRLV